jgi:lysophospholipase L1-like esterase
MTMQRNKHRTWNLGSIAVASVLAFGGCADIVDGDDEELEAPVLQQSIDGSTKAGGFLQEADAGTAGGPRWNQREDQGKGDGKDVVVIGDSWMTMYGGGLQGALETANGREATYRKFGVPATRLLNGQIPGQFDQAVRQNKNIKTVFMTGGGNDVLLSPSATASCRDPSCTTLKNIGEGLRKLWEKMGAAGVQDVIYVGYSEGAGSSPPVVTNVSKNGISAICDAMTSINCHWIDSTPIVKGRLQDGIHPTGAAHKELAEAAMKLATERKVRR